MLFANTQPIRDLCRVIIDEGEARINNRAIEIEIHKNRVIQIFFADIEPLYKLEEAAAILSTTATRFLQQNRW